jgi:hypothetical protein
MIDDFLMIAYKIHLITLWSEVQYGPSSVLLTYDCPDTQISVTVCDFKNYSGLQCGKLSWK